MASEGNQFDAGQFDSKMNQLLSSDGQDFITSYDEVYDSFDSMGLQENLLRGIYAYATAFGQLWRLEPLPRINMIPSDNKIPFKFKRRQFPLSVCFAMTINKSQGQSLSKVGLYLREPVFTHGQLYVALSRVKSRDGVKLLILNKDGKPETETTNVVFKEIFSNL